MVIRINYFIREPAAVEDFALLIVILLKMANTWLSLGSQQMFGGNKSKVIKKTLKLTKLFHICARSIICNVTTYYCMLVFALFSAYSCMLCQ